MSATALSFVRMAFEGQSRRVVEACVAGGVVGMCVKAFKSTLVDPPCSIDARLTCFVYLSTFEPEISFLLTNLLRVVTLFVPSMVPDTLIMAEYMDDMAACALASATNATRASDAPFLCHVLASRVRGIIANITVSFPYDSPSRMKAEEAAQRLYEYQDAMYTEVRGYARLARLA